ncbi:NAD(+) kinase [soil metagenome]
MSDRTPASAMIQPKSIGLVAALSKDEAQDLSEDVSAFLINSGINVFAEESLAPDARKQVDMIVALGGDGLMMRAAQTYADVPILGINFGKVGFLANVEKDDWKSALSALIKGDYSIQESSTLDAILVHERGKEHQGWAINDVVIRSGVRMIDVEVYVDGHFVNTYPGDGMIVATARGSTAYCMAAGGPILTSGVRGFAIVPISCHSPIRTPLVVEESAKIELLFNTRHDASLILDGRVTSELAPGDIVSISLGQHKCRLINVANTDFYEAFRTKFNFRIRPDVAPSLPADGSQR